MLSEAEKMETFILRELDHELITGLFFSVSSCFFLYWGSFVAELFSDLWGRPVQVEASVIAPKVCGHGRK